MENEGDRQRGRARVERWEWVGGGKHSLPHFQVFPRSKGCLGLPCMDTMCPSNQALFCFGYFEVSLCVSKPRDLFQIEGLLWWSRRGLRRACCRARGEDGGEGPGGRNLCGVPCVGTELLECGSRPAQREAERMDIRFQDGVTITKLPFSILCMRG